MALIMSNQDLEDLTGGLYKGKALNNDIIFNNMAFTIGFLTTLYLIKIFYGH